MLTGVLAVALALDPPGPIASGRLDLGEGRPVGSFGHRRDLGIVEDLRSVDEDISLLGVLVGRGSVFHLVRRP